ncbi:DUF1583 domain-containing protein [Thalassoroseus pseudoceratinae]|uniref:DUF1583 domain-containing protein n=1 Tax=Thalassoroseus pseudoceratinae TaxID=2713176 RepID=UPI001422A5A0|nr:DUF1583 domain-containing protein [Thalassoroseus pseudoceratinae]
MKSPVFLLLTGLVFAVGFVNSQRLPAQESDDAQAVVRTQSQAILTQLRQDDIEPALDAFGELVDSSDVATLDGVSVLPAVLGGLARELAQLDEQERYDVLLKWTLPTESRNSVRLVTLTVPQSAPPKDFAREIGERARDETFAVPQMNGLPGLFCTGWMLARTADELGQLSRLQLTLDELADENIPGAKPMALLAKLADNRVNAEPLKTQWEQLLQSETVSTQVAIALAALQHDELHEFAERSLKPLAFSPNATDSRPFHRLAHAVAVQHHRGVSEPEVLFQNRLKYWVPVSGATAVTNAFGGAPSVWLTHEEHIMHLAGTGSDVLFFKYPLTGRFEFTCETQEGGDIGTDGGLVYGGLQFEAIGRENILNVWNADQWQLTRQPNHFTRHESTPTFNRVTIRRSQSGPQFLANLHPVWTDSVATEASPWLGLRSFANKRPVFRNFRFRGKPEIPRQVEMLQGDTLRGWQTSFYEESQPHFAPSEDVEEPPADWRMTGGVLEATQTEDAGSLGSQSVIRYHRPLLDGESVTYEFFYQADQFEAHPVLGRMAFLLEPRGVRVHWLTAGPYEWTGLAEDNALLEPFNRRGPRPLPLKEDDWNTVRLERKNDRITLSLNNETIYQRGLDFTGDLQFGIYRNRTKSSVRMRNAILQGDWPEEFPQELLDNPEQITATE